MALLNRFRLPFLHLRRFVASSEAVEFPRVKQSDLDTAVKNLYAQHAQIPIVIGNQNIFTGDAQKLMMPHNHRKSVAHFCYATKNHIYIARNKALAIQDEWGDTDVKERAEIFRNAVKILTTPEKSVELVAAIMLGQAKTMHECERDVDRLIRMMLLLADEVVRISQTKLRDFSKDIVSRFILRPLEGFVASTGPISMCWVAAHMAFEPLILGNVVLWRPPRVCVHATYIVFKAMIDAGIPNGALQFLPCNYRLFLETVCRCPELAGINYSGRLVTLRTLWHDMATRLDKYRYFPRVEGDCESKGFHFIHESADRDLVVDLTVRAAFRYTGQRPDSCNQLFVPDTMWPEIKPLIIARTKQIKFGDPTDKDAFSSAIIHPQAFGDTVSALKYAEESEECQIVFGGAHNDSYGYFVEPTIIECQNPADPLLVTDLLGPILCVYVYKSDNLEETFSLIRNSHKYAGGGSIFASDKPCIEYLIQKLHMNAKNLFINNQCCSKSFSPLPLYMFRFAAPQIVETMNTANEKESSNESTAKKKNMNFYT